MKCRMRGASAKAGEAGMYTEYNCEHIFSSQIRHVCLADKLCGHNLRKTNPFSNKANPQGWSVGHPLSVVAPCQRHMGNPWNRLQQVPSPSGLLRGPPQAAACQYKEGESALCAGAGAVVMKHRDGVFRCICAPHFMRRKSGQARTLLAPGMYWKARGPGGGSRCG